MFNKVGKDDGRKFHEPHHSNAIPKDRDEIWRNMGHRGMSVGIKHFICNLDWSRDANITIVLVFRIYGRTRDCHLHQKSAES